MPISLRAGIGGKAAKYPAFSASIILFDTQPGARSWTAPKGVRRVRVFVVGAGGAGGANGRGCGGGYCEKVLDVSPGTTYNYTVGAGGKSSAFGALANGGSSSFGGTLSATGGRGNASVAEGALGGIGIGGDINSRGGLGGEGNIAGGSAGHAYGNGNTPGFAPDNQPQYDGWKLGLYPGQDGYGVGGNVNSFVNGGIGAGASRFDWGFTSTNDYVHGTPGFGAGSAYAGDGGHGVVGIEVVE